jgi:single-stranded-DNA-specific exonuclease
VTDHHLTGDELPIAAAVVNPRRDDCVSEFKNYCGAALALMLVCALEGCLGEEMPRAAALAAIGTVADIVPLTGDNRALVRFGLEQINRLSQPEKGGSGPETEFPGLYALLEVAGLAGKPVNARSVSFGLAPRINAAGRMGRASRAVDLLLSENYDEALFLAKEINAENINRRHLESGITAEILQSVAQNGLWRDRVIVAAGNGWHQGVVGIAASRVAEFLGKPCIVLSSDGETAVGSGRSIAGFPIFDAVNSCAFLLQKFGGHEMALGLTLKQADIGEFRRLVNEFAKEKVPSMPFPELNLDCRLNPAALVPDMVLALNQLEPFGSGNPAPVFLLSGLRLECVTGLSSGKHVKLNLSKDSAQVQALFFSAPLDTFPYRAGDVLDLAVSLELSEFRGQTELSVRVRDLRFSGIDQEELLADIRRYEAIAAGERPGSQWVPNRDEIGAVFKQLRGSGCKDLPAEVLAHRSGVTYSKTRLALDALAELGIINGRFSGGLITAETTGKKADLADSEILKLKNK